MKRRDSMNTKVIRVSALCVLVSFAALFTACDVLGPEPAPAPVVAATPDEKALVSVRVGMWGRTVMPTVGLEYVDSWELLGAKQGGSQTSLLVFTMLDENTIIALEPGTWSFTLKGVRAGVLALSGSIEDKAISLEGENILAFYVEPAESGEGTVTLVIKLPAGSGITEAKVFKDGVEHGSPIPPVADTIAFTETSLTGAYYYSFKLYNAEPKLLGVVSEVVYVWANLESEKTYTLLQKDLNLTYTIRYHVPDEPMADGHYQIATAVTLAAPSPRDGYYFKGWYEQADLSGSAVTRIPVGSTGDKAFYSKWIPQRLSTDTLTPFSLANALALIKADAGEGDVYTIIVNTDETLAPQTLSYDGKTVSITLEGGAEKWIVCLSSNGALFALESGVTLKLGNITLQGKSGNTASLVTVSSGATLEINAGAKISGNTKSGNDGGGVYVNGGTLTMTGGEISDNTTNSGGGVSLYNNSRFTMSGGYISNNFSKSGTGGGGVRLENSKFTMSGGTISGNTTAGGSGGGVRVNTSSMFTMSGGTISGNTTAGNVGGGVYTSNTFTMTGGTISGNIASSNGGGVYASSKFTMSGGTISGNTTTNGNGGGVYGGITKSGGTIYGSEADEPLKNTAGSGAGHAAYAAADKVRDSTAGVGADLNSAQSGAAGGWELPATFSPSQSLEWIRANAGDGDVYTITLTTDESLAPQTLSYDGKTVSVTLEGEGAERTVSLSSNGSLFTVGKGVTLTLDSNITLEGLSDNNAALVMVHSGGALKMKDDSKISNNTISSGVGGGGVLLTTGTFVKGKHNEMAENTMREMLTAVPDRDFDKAVSQLYTVSNRYGLDLSAIKLAIANFGAMADDTPAGYVRGPGGGLIHLGTEAQCDCCGHHYLWSQMADEYLNAEKDWWGYCPVCGLNGDEQANAHRAIRRAGEIPEGYSAILDRLYQRYAERDFQPIKTRAEVKKALENRDRVHERLSVQAKLMELEQSYKDRVKKYKDKEMDREKYT